MSYPQNLKYTKDHEWLLINGNEVTIGITDYAQSELGDIVFVDIPTEGEAVAAGEAFGSIEAVKTVSDLLTPIAIEDVQFNAELEDAPELVNQDPYGKGWIIKATIADLDETTGLLSAEEYEAIL